MLKASFLMIANCTNVRMRLALFALKRLSVIILLTENVYSSVLAKIG